MQKMIFLLHHEPSEGFKKYSGELTEDLKSKFRVLETIESSKKDKGICFFEDHTVKKAENFKELYPQINVEHWRPYGDDINEIYEKEINGVKHRIFPSKSKNLPRIGAVIKSVELYKALLEESKKNEIVLFFLVSHSFFGRWLLPKFKKRTFPIILNHGSSALAVFYLKLMPFYKKIINSWYLLRYLKEMAVLKEADYYYTCSMVEKEYLTARNYTNVDYLKYGADYDLFKPAEDKEKLKVSLGLNPAKKYIIYVGAFTDVKSLKVLIDKTEELQKIRDDVDLICVGGTRDEIYYEYGRRKGFKMVESLHKHELVEFVKAADLYCMPTMNTIIINHAGFGTAPIEALACGIPIFTNNIIHFPGTAEEQKKVGMRTGDETEFLDNLQYMLNNLNKFKECREISGKYFDLEVFTKTVYDKAVELSGKYYSR